MSARASVVAVLALTFIGLVLPAHAQSDSDRYTIMRPEPGRPEPWLAPKYQSPRGTREHVVVPRSRTVRQPRAEVPPPIIVPQTGIALPNMPTVSPSGPGGRETYQDRAVRCAHQAGAYGANAGDRGTYIGTCVNQ